MIQRIQSLYLLLTTVFSVLFLNGSIIKFVDVSNNSVIINFGGINKVIAGGGNEPIEKLISLSVLLILIPVVSLITIFLFKKRKSQIKFAIALLGIIVILICTIVYYANYVIQNFNAEILPDANLILPLLMLICTYLAYRGIRKDEDLVKSYDRLR